MERAARRSQNPARLGSGRTLTPPPADARTGGAFSPHEAPLLLALALAPLVAGYQDPLPPLLLGLLAWSAVLLRLLPRRGPEATLPQGAGAALAFLLLAAATFPFSANRGATTLQVALYAGYAAVAWLAADTLRRDDGGAARRRLLGALLAGALVAGGLGLREYLTELRGGNPSWRAFSRFTNPNFCAGYLVPSLLLLLGAALDRPEAFRPGTWRLSTGLAAAALGGGVLATGSRGGLYSLVLGLFVLLGLAAARRCLRDPERRSTLLLLCGILLVVGVGFSAPLRSREGAAPLPGAAAPTDTALPAELCPHAASPGSGTADSNRFRVLTWSGSLEMGRRRPVLGWGAGSFETAFARHAVAGYTRHAHNGYLQLFAEEGAAAPLLWLALLAASLLGLARVGGGVGGGWAVGAAAALLATGAHNLLDSLVFVPAVAVLTWTLVGLGLAGLGWRTPAPSTAAARCRTGVLAGVGLALALTATHALGRVFLDNGKALAAANPREALGYLNAAAALLPFEHQAAAAQSRALAAIGDIEGSVRAALRAIVCAPERPAGYAALAALRRYQQNLPTAVLTYEQGLRHAPNEPELLYAAAQLHEELGNRREATALYRRLHALELSPAGQVHALGEVRDYRFSRARLALARDSAAAGRAEEAWDHLKSGACLLAERRRMYDANPVPFVQLGERDRQAERDLRSQERQVWEQVAQEYRRRGENRLAELSAEQASAADRSLERLEELFRTYAALYEG